MPEEEVEKLKGQLKNARAAFLLVQKLLNNFVAEKEGEVEKLKSENKALREKLEMFESHDEDLQRLKTELSEEKKRFKN